MAPAQKTVWKRMKESLGILLIGDGLVAEFSPKRHSALWVQGPRFWKKSMKAFVERPELTRLLAALGCTFGAFLAARQKPAKQG